MGLYAPDGTLAAVHRGMRWHRHLLLKGVFVDDGFRGSGAGLGAAFAIRDWARSVGFDGILVWVERDKRESQLATRLRVRPDGPLIHRYLVPLPSAGAAAHPGAGVGRPAAGVLTVPLTGRGAALRELLGIEQDGSGGTRLGWILDRSRLVLGGNPCRSITELEILVAATAEAVGLTGAMSLEIPFEAADIHAALSLAGIGAKRLSRVPVRLGLLPFGDQVAEGSVQQGLLQRAPKAVGR